VAENHDFELPWRIQRVGEGQGARETGAGGWDDTRASGEDAAEPGGVEVRVGGPREGAAGVGGSREGAAERALSMGEKAKEDVVEIEDASRNLGDAALRGGGTRAADAELLPRLGNKSARELYWLWKEGEGERERLATKAGEGVAGHGGWGRWVGDERAVDDGKGLEFWREKALEMQGEVDRQYDLNWVSR
jgi:hypothetical protein